VIWEAVVAGWRGVARRSAQRVGVALAIVTVALLPIAPASATTAIATRNCTVQDANWLLKHFLKADTEFRDRCSYRLFLEGQPVHFTQRDTFLGGLVSAIYYEANGISRTDALVKLQADRVRVWLAPVLADGTSGDPVEQLVQVTQIKDGEIFGNTVVYHQFGVILTLLPGDYVTILEFRIEGLPPDLHTVHITIDP